MSTASVSVVIPCYKCRQTIERTISSVVAQTVLPLEVILVDDNSCDDTVRKLHELQLRYSDSWIKVIELEKNVGPGEARNAGWFIANGNYIAFLDADDSWHPRKIESQYFWMRNHPNVILSGHPVPLAKNETKDNVIDVSYVDFHEITSKYKFLSRNYFPTPSVMVRSDVEYRFDLGKRHSEDFLLWARLFFAGGRIAVSKAPLAYLHKRPFGEGGLSANLWAMTKGAQDSYKRLWSEGKIGSFEYRIFFILLYLKYLRRVFLASFK